MKKFISFVFVFVFLLSMAVLPAQAKGPAVSTTFAYIPLVKPTQADPLQVAYLARQSFEALSSHLLDAQRNGQVVRFEPDFAAGMLKVEYPVNGNLAQALALDPKETPAIFSNPKSVLEYTQVGRNINRPNRAGQVNALDGTPYIDINLYDSCIYAGNMGADNFFLVTLKDTSSRLVATASGYADGDGYMSDCFSGTWATMTPGYTVTFKVYTNDRSSLLNTYSTVITRLTYSSISLSSKTIKGTAPAYASLDFYWGHPLLNNNQDWVDTDFPVTATKKGAWTAKLAPTVAVRGGDEMDITMQNFGSVFYFHRYISAPYIYCRVGGYYCYIYGVPAASASLSIKHAKKTYTFTGKFYGSGYFYGVLYDANMDPIFLLPGDKVSGTSVKSYALPTLTALPDFSGNIINGIAPANCYFDIELDVYNPTEGWWDWDNRWVSSNGSGNYAANFNSSFDITPADRLEIYIYFTDPLTGNETSALIPIAP